MREIPLLHGTCFGEMVELGLIGGSRENCVEILDNVQPPSEK